MLMPRFAKRDPKYLVDDFRYAWEHRNDKDWASKNYQGLSDADKLKYHKTISRQLLRHLVREIRAERKRKASEPKEVQQTLF